jgi:hypothetical protein
LQNVPFAASNHMVTHNQAYFDKINSKNQINPNKNQTTPAPVTSKQPVTLNPPANSLPWWVTISGQTTPATSSFPTKSNRKTLKNTNSTSKIDSNASKIDSNASKSIIMLQKSILMPIK